MVGENGEGELCVCVCRGWFLVCLMDNVVTRFCTRWVIRRSGFLLVVVRTFVKLVWPFFFLISIKSKAAAIRPQMKCVCLFFFFICREEVELEEEDAHLIISRWFIIFKSVEPLTEFYFGWLVCHLCNSSFSRLFPKYFSIWLTGTTTWRRNRRIGRGRARTTHVHARTDLWKGNTTRGEQRGGGGEGLLKLLPNSIFTCPSSSILDELVSGYFCRRRRYLIVTKQKKKKKKTTGPAHQQLNHTKLFFLLNGYVALCFVLSLFIFPFGHVANWRWGGGRDKEAFKKGGVGGNAKMIFFFLLFLLPLLLY